jgi:hypothetical protein
MPIASYPGGESVKPIAVTVATAKSITGLGNTTIWKLIKEQKLETRRVGNRVLVLVRSIERLLGIDGAAP